MFTYVCVFFVEFLLQVFKQKNGMYFPSWSQESRKTPKFGAKPTNKGEPQGGRGGLSQLKAALLEAIALEGPIATIVSPMALY